ncbi:MAG: Ketosteroid isomerase-related protein [Solirubrobacterales bacterium]|jgi:ketosteroid isomerase-like protein|nr:Ketosteroid isomerase-related protein [Solirubrobacterales bacterium]
MSEQSVEFVEGIYGAFGRGDVPAVLGSFADDIEWFEAEGMPYGGLHRGPEAVAQNVFGPITEDVEGFAVTPEELIGSGATVAAVVRYTGTGKATGKALDVPVVHVWDIRDGKAARFRQFIDTVKFAEVVPAGVPAA